jgi:hypothetical protein
LFTCGATPRGSSTLPLLHHAGAPFPQSRRPVKKNHRLAKRVYRGGKNGKRRCGSNGSSGNSSGGQDREYPSTVPIRTIESRGGRWASGSRSTTTTARETCS